MLARLAIAAVLLAALAASPALANPPVPNAPHAGPHDGYLFGLGYGWTNKYYPVYNCPAGQQRPCNPLFAVPIYSSFGQTGPKRMLLWPPQVNSPLYDNTPRMMPYQPQDRKCPGNCAYYETRRPPNHPLLPPPVHQPSVP